MWIEQSYKQVKQTLGWAQYQVRSDIAIRRHWQLVFCAFSFCWWASGQAETAGGEQPIDVEEMTTMPAATQESGEKGKASVQLAYGFKKGEGMAGTLLHAHALLASVVGQISTSAIASAA